MKILKNNLLDNINNINCKWCTTNKANIINIWQNPEYSQDIYYSFYCYVCFHYTNNEFIISSKFLSNFSNINDLQSFINSFYKYTLLQ